MKFFPVKTEIIYTGQPYLYNNNHNEIFFQSYCRSNAVIQFGDWGQELNVNSETRAIMSFEACFSPKKVQKVDLNVPKFADAKVTFDIAENMRAMKIYYDDSNGWFCFGNKDSQGEGFQFATDTIAVIRDHTLEAIFIHPCKKYSCLDK